MIGLSTKSSRVVWLFFAIILATLAAFYMSMFVTYQEAQADIESMQPRIARFLAAQEHEKSFEAANVQSELVLAQQVHLSGDETAITSQLQQDVRSAFEGVGLNVSASQILPAKNEQQLSRLYLDITASGSVVALNDALAVLEAARPKIYTEWVNIQPVRQRRGPVVSQVINARFRLFVMRGLLEE